MAKKIDPFDKFREATLGGGNALGAALSGGSDSRSERVESTPTVPSPAVKKSKTSNRTLKSFHIDNDVFRKLGQISMRTEFPMTISITRLSVISW